MSTNFIIYTVKLRDIPQKKCSRNCSRMCFNKVFLKAEYDCPPHFSDFYWQHIKKTVKSCSFTSQKYSTCVGLSNQIPIKYFTICGCNMKEKNAKEFTLANHFTSPKLSGSLICFI